MNTRLQTFSTGQTTDAQSATGVILFDVYAAGKPEDGSQGPLWVKLAPRGRFTARDGRQLEVDPELLVRRFDADAVDLPIDIDHATAKGGLFGDAAPAIGWINKLEARPDGLYGRTEWLDEGMKILKARSHRYISPSLKPDQFGKALWLHSAGLVAAPGISMPALAGAEFSSQTKEPQMSKAIALALGLTEDASETSCLSAIQTLSAGRIEKTVHEEALSSLQAVTTELETLKSETRKGKVDELIEGALKAKKITPAQRQHYETLCATDAGLTSVTALFEAMTAKLGDTGLDNKPAPGQADQQNLDAGDVDIMALSANIRTRVQEAAARGVVLNYDAEFDLALSEITKS